MNLSPQVMMEAQVIPCPACLLNREKDVVERNIGKNINSTSLGRSKIPILLSNLAFYLMLDSGDTVDHLRALHSEENKNKLELLRRCILKVNEGLIT